MPSLTTLKASCSTNQRARSLRPLVVAVATAVLMSSTLLPSRVSAADDSTADTPELVYSRIDSVAVSVPLASGLTRETAGTCRRITATSKYVATVGTLWTFTSGAVYCFKQKVRITYFAWDSAGGYVTKAGQLAGWQYKGAAQKRSRLDACRYRGSSIGHFIQSYPIIGQIGSVDAPQNVLVSCKGSTPEWS